MSARPKPEERGDGEGEQHSDDHHHDHHLDESEPLFAGSARRSVAIPHPQISAVGPTDLESDPGGPCVILFWVSGGCVGGLGGGGVCRGG